MATPRMDVTSFVGKLLEENDVDLLREGVGVLAQAVMETEVSAQIGAAPLRAKLRAHRLSQRLSHQDLGHAGRHDRAQDPKGFLRDLLPVVLEPRRRAEKALHAVGVEAYVKNVSTRKVDDLVRALGSTVYI